jgi:hypothetical protein
MIITEFVLARIAEDEAAAQAALGQAPSSGLRDFDEGHDAGLAARWSPARVLAECTAKRTIVEAFEELGQFLTRASDGGTEDTAAGVRDMFAGLMIAVQAHAGAYADHPDYRPEWRPRA